MYSVGIIGVGRIACELPDNHVKAYLACKDTHIVALCDINISKAWDCREKYGLDCECYDDIRKMRTDLDIISLCTRPENHWSNHYDIINHFPNLKGFYLEKPVAEKIRDAQDIIDSCKERGIILQVNHQRRFGRTKATFSRGMENTGTHMFDMLRMYFGEINQYQGNAVITSNGLVIDIEFIDDASHVFKLETTGSIVNGVEHLIECVRENKQSVSSGEDGLKALMLCKQFSRK